MSDQSNARGHGVVMQPDDGPSFWQPVPANGHAEPKLFPGPNDVEGRESVVLRPIDLDGLELDLEPQGPQIGAALERRLDRRDDVGQALLGAGCVD